MEQRRARRTMSNVVVALAASAAATGLGAGLTVGPVGPAVAAPVTRGDAQAAQLAADWLAAQLDHGAIRDDAGRVDHALTVGAIVALHAGARPGRAQAAVRVLDDHDAGVGDYLTLRDQVAGGEQDRLAGPTAASLLAALTAAADPHDLGGFDLVAETVASVVTPADVAPGGRFTVAGGNGYDVPADAVGRVVDHGPHVTVDGAGTAAQAVAVIALAETGDLTAAMVDQLADRQCAAGWFRASYAEDAAACDEPAVPPDPAVTALALAAVDAATQAGVEAALDYPAEAWLTEVRQGDGGWGPIGTGSLTTTTGLVEVATELDSPYDQPPRPAYLPTVLVDDDLAHGTLSGERGAAAPSVGDLEDATTTGIPDDDRLAWVAATESAVLGLGKSSLAELARGPVVVHPPRGWVLAGRTASVRLSRLDPGEHFLVAIGPSIADVVAEAPRAAVSVVVPDRSRTGRREVEVYPASYGDPLSRRAHAFVRVLADEPLRVSVDDRTPTRGARVEVVVRGLGAGEPVTVTVGDRRVSGRGDGHGVLRREVRVSGRGEVRVAARSDVFGVRRAVTAVSVRGR